MLMTVSGIQLESSPSRSLAKFVWGLVSQGVFDNIAVALSDERLQE